MATLPKEASLYAEGHPEEAKAAMYAAAGAMLEKAFPGRDRGAFSKVRLTGMMLDYVNEAGIGKKAACHLFRHTAATLLLEGGMDIRYIQALLGHAELNTTQIYTLVSVGKLKAMHTAMHPGPFPEAGGQTPEEEVERC